MGGAGGGVGRVRAPALAYPPPLPAGHQQVTSRAAVKASRSPSRPGSEPLAVGKIPPKIPGFG